MVSKKLDIKNKFDRSYISIGFLGLTVGDYLIIYKYIKMIELLFSKDEMVPVFLND